MEKILNFIKSKTIIDIILLIAVFFLFFYFFGFSMNSVFSDRGREFVFPLWISEGYAPYKDFVTIYFPLSYYINAFAYKVLGVSIDSLIISQTFFCMLFISFYYLITREFLNRKSAFFITVFIILSCMFNMLDMFGYIIPYCYGRVHGLTGSIICLYGIIKLHKTDNIKFAYLAALATGFAISCKVEFTVFILFLFIGLLLYKKLKITQYLKIILCLLVFPFITLSLLFLNGVRIPDIINSIKFSMKFYATPGMQYFYSFIGLVPDIDVFIQDSSKYLKAILELGIVMFFSVLNCHFNKKYLTPVFFIITLCICYWFNSSGFLNLNIEFHTDYIFLIVFALFLIFHKNILKDKTVFLLLIATVFISFREIFKTHLFNQGSFSVPVILLFIFTVFENYLSKYITKEKMTKIITFFFIVLICSYFIQWYKTKVNFYTPLITNKGTVYMCPDISLAMDRTLTYIEENIPEDKKILVLPEGMTINYFTDRDINRNCFLMDRLYHDAYGENEAYEKIKNTNSDYIILVNGFDLFNFGYDYLYYENASLSANYIFENYSKVFSSYGVDNFSNITIYKKNSE